jgi:hypothetical protein
MKAKRVAYWVSTAWVVVVMTVSGTMAAVHAPRMMAGLAHLGYPAYFANLLGVAKLSGVCALLGPRMVRLKEWAYAGFAITVISAAYSHLSSGDGLMALDPLVTLAALVVSYRTRPVDRRVFFVSGTAERGDSAGKILGVSN